MILPDSFKNTMKRYLYEEKYQKLINSLNEKPVSGIRINKIKDYNLNYRNILNKSLKSIPWCSCGFYLPTLKGNDRYSLKIEYHQGLLYIQEPSAMLPIEILNPKSGDKIADLCAAPGGKTTQIASLIGDEGFILANEITPKRAYTLVRNIEIAGIKNTIIVSTSPKKIELEYGNFFDKVLVDAPCSGEGTFRKDSKNIQFYSKMDMDKLYETQREILNNGANILKVGGSLVYSTCTFNPFENEKIIADFLATRSDFKLVKIPSFEGIEREIGDFLSESDEVKIARIYPFKTLGEGHFVALLKRISGDNNKVNSDGIPECNLPLEIKMEINKITNKKLKGHFYKLDNKYYLIENDYFVPENIKIHKIGVLLGEMKNNRFVISHSFIQTLKLSEIRNYIEVDKENGNRYIKGETLSIRRPKNTYILIYNGNPLGMAKIDRDYFKNLYPKELRKRY